MLNKTQNLQVIQENWKLEGIQRNCQKDKINIFQQQDSWNYIKKLKTMGPNKLGQ